MAFGAFQEHLDGAAELGTLDIVELQMPQPAVQRQARGGHEVEVVAVAPTRIPRAVLGSLKPRDHGGDRRLLQRQRVERGDVAKVVEAESTRADEPARGGAEAEIVALLRHGLAADRDLQPVQGAVGETGPVDDAPLVRLGADVDVDLAREGARSRRGAQVTVVGEHHDRLPLRMRAGHRVLVGHPAQSRQLPRLAGMRAGGDPRPRAPLRHLFTVHVDALRRALPLMPERAGSREITRAMSLPYRGAGHVLLGRGIPQEHLLGRRREILALHDLQRPAIDLPPGNEGALRAVGARDAVGREELVIHDEREVVKVAVEGAQPVRDSHHPIAADRVTGRENRYRAHARKGREQIGLGRRTGRDGMGQRSSRLQERGAGEQQRCRRQCAFQE